MPGTDDPDNMVTQITCAFLGQVAALITPITFRGSSAAYRAVDEKHIDSKSNVYIDSGCTKTVFCNFKKMINTRKPDGEHIAKGVEGNIRVANMGDFPMALKHKHGTLHVKVMT